MRFLILAWLVLEKEARSARWGYPPTGLRPKQGTIFTLQIFESEGISLGVGKG